MQRSATVRQYRSPSGQTLLYAACCMSRRTQLYLDEAQYGWLKRQAGQQGSIAGVVRRLIDDARTPRSPTQPDPFVEYLLDEPPGQGHAETSVTTLDRDVYRS